MVALNFAGVTRFFFGLEEERNKNRTGGVEEDKVLWAIHSGVSPIGERER